MKKRVIDPIDEDDEELDRFLALDDDKLAKFEKTRAPRPSKGGRERDRDSERRARPDKF